MFSAHVVKIFDMPRACQKIMGYLLNEMNDENVVVIACGSKTMMIDKINIARQTLDNNLLRLTNSGIISNPKKGVYIVNPEIFSLKKKWGDILNQQKKFNAVMNYSGNGKFSIKGSFLK